MHVPRIELTPGYSISQIIRGGWQLAEGHHRAGVNAEAGIEGMRACVDAGITTFDCADIYTGVEELIGRFLRTHRGERLIQIHTKYVPDLDSLATLTENDIKATIDRSLQRLGVERLDLVQFHWWDFDIPGYVEAAATLDKLRQRGKIRHVGATNFDVDHLAEIVNEGIPVVSNQVQYSVLDRRPAEHMTAWCAERGISLLCYGTLAGGFLTDRYLGTPSADEPFENRSLTKYRLIIEEVGGWSRYQEILHVLHAVASRYGVSISIVAMRFVLDCPQVAAAIVGIQHPSHVTEAARVFDLSLDAEDQQALRACSAQGEGPSGSVYGLERIKGGRHTAVMKTDLNKQ